MKECKYHAQNIDPTWLNLESRTQKFNRVSRTLVLHNTYDAAKIISVGHN